MRSLLVYALLILNLFSCESENENEPGLPIEIQLVTLDLNYQKKTEFVRNEKIFFALEIENLSDNEIIWYSWCGTLNDDNIYKVFTYDRGTLRPARLVGSPVPSGVSCLTISQTIKKGKGFYLIINWDLEPKKIPLDKGKYLAISAAVINIPGYAPLKKSRSALFEVR